MPKTDIYAAALKAFDRAIKINPEHVDSWWGKSVVLLMLDKYQEALEVCEKVIQFNPEDADSWWIKGAALLGLERYKEALENFNKAIELKTEDASSWQDKAEASYHIGLTNDSLEAIEKALSYEEGKPSFLNTKGVILLRLGRNEEAAQLFEEASHEESEHLFMYNKAVALVRLQRFSEAEEALERAVELASSDKSRKSKDSAKKYRKQLYILRRRESPIIWIAWWYTGVGWQVWGKRILGSLLLLLLALYLILPLITLNIELLQKQGRMWWVSAGQDWQLYIVPVISILVILLSPMLRRFGPQGVELSPILPPPEAEARRIVEEMQPRFE